ncbi:MAG: TlpA family protein disulfide reductase [Deltaproteobacteria bacterium]|nr:TlpA family protein disulfide reductase [Deltaproteobacteria bacterium]
MRNVGWAALALGLGILPCCATRSAQPIGPRPYEVCLPLSGGGMLQLADYRGKVLVVDFFTTWSRPSMVAVPVWSSLAQKYGPRGLAVVGVAMDEIGDDVVRPYAAGMGLSYPVLLADEAVREGRSAFGPIEAIPMTLIFDRLGRLTRILVGLVPAAEMEGAVLELLD